MKYYIEIDGNKEYFNGISAVIGDFTVINPTEDELIKAGYIKEEETAPVETLDDVKEAKINEISEYAMSSEVNEFEFKGAKAWIDADTRVKYAASVDAAITIGQDKLTLPIANNLVTVSAQEAKKMLAAVLLYADATYFITQKHKAAVMQLTTKKAVKEYNYKVGYPSKLKF